MRTCQLAVTQLEARDVPTAFTEMPIVPEFDPETVARVSEIVQRGKQLGMREDVFLKVGDSNTAVHEAFQPLGRITYNPVLSGLTAYGPDIVNTYRRYLAPVGLPGENSYTRNGYTSRAATMLSQQLSGFASEIATTKASVALIMDGTNDHWNVDAQTFRNLLQQAIDQFANAGVVPILTTVPWDRMFLVPEQDSTIAVFNQTITDVATENRIPVINLWRAIERLPNSGLKVTSEWAPNRDFRHLSSSPLNPGGFSAFDLLFGQNIRHLITLQTLNELHKVAFANPDPLPETSWTPLTAGQAVFATSSSVGLPTVISIADAKTGQTLNRITPFGSNFRGGASVAIADVNNDKIADIVVGAGRTGGPHVTVYSGANGQVLNTFFAYEPDFRGGVNVAAGDLNHDGTVEIVAGAGVGGAPRVRVFRGSDLAVMQDYYAFEPEARGGVNVAVGDFGASLGPTIIAGAGVGGGPIIKLFNLNSNEAVRAFYVGDPATRNGIYMTAGDLDADGKVDLIAANGQRAEIHIVDPDRGVDRSSFTLPDPVPYFGPRLVFLPQQGERRPLIAVEDATGDPARARFFKASGDMIRGLNL